MSIKDKISPLDTTDVIEGIEETNRKLASIQRIETINDIPGADKIQVATMENLGWQCVVKRGDFNVGDKIVYLETDSICPQKPEFEFLRERKFRIKIIKLRKQVSEGLIMPLSILPTDRNYDVGENVSQILQISKHDPEGKLERALIEKEKRSPLMRFLMGIKPFRYIYLKLNSQVKGNWPVELCGPKTEEHRIQVAVKHLMEHYNENWYITEKLDGCLHEGTLVITKDGTKKIEDICEEYKNNKKPIFVMSYDVDNKNPEWRKVNGCMVQENNDDWYEIETENSEKVVLTGNHLVFVSDLKCWRKVSDLNGNEKILLKKKE